MQSILQITNYHPLLGNRERVKRREYETIDWEQRRYEIAKELFPSMLNVGEKHNASFAAILAVNCADVLINRF